MRRMLWLILILLISVLVGLQLKFDPGYVLITLNHWMVETSVWFLVISLCFIIFFSHQLLLMLRAITRLPTNYHHWKSRHTARIAQQKTRQGLIEFSEGYWSKAKTHLIKALPNTDMPLLNYLTAARAAQELGDPQLRDTYLREAQQSMPEAQIAVELTQAQLQLANHQWEQALATLRHLQEIAPKHPYVLKLLMDLYQKIEDWPQLISLLPDLKKHHLLTPIDCEKLTQRAYLNALNKCIHHHQDPAISQLMSTLPKALMMDSDIVSAYAHYLIQTESTEKAESVLTNALRKAFHPKLIQCYGQLPGTLKQLQFAESFLKKQPHSAELFLCMGRLSMINQLWGKAKSYLDQSIFIRPTPAAYAALGQFYEIQQDVHKACEAYREGLGMLAECQSPPQSAK